MEIVQIEARGIVVRRKRQESQSQPSHMLEPTDYEYMWSASPVEISAMSPKTLKWSSLDNDYMMFFESIDDAKDLIQKYQRYHNPKIEVLATVDPE